MGQDTLHTWPLLPCSHLSQGTSGAGGGGNSYHWPREPSARELSMVGVTLAPDNPQASPWHSLRRRRNNPYGQTWGAYRGPPARR